MPDADGAWPGRTSGLATPSEVTIPIANAPTISEGTESGWAAIANSIREVDEEKVKDYKEDIDTILVFAGLYSAVLSALLVESVTSLQPDPNAIMIKLLSQVVIQTHSYSLASDQLTSTAPLLDVNSVQDFQPSLAAKRVNILWFASLALSLISASFGILVKQWLREYLAGEYVSPQARLRIRHFRTPGLENWGVFALAALLPLVLQLALALFFVGLCFFTLDVHSSIGYTTIPLVAGWALLFVAASLAPVLSPRCPYKISLFKHVMQGIRDTVFNIAWAMKGFVALPETSQWPIEMHWSWWSLGYNEEDAAKDLRQDVNILIAVDATQMDDRLVLKACSALIETDASSDAILDFVVQAINFRLQSEAARRPFPPMLYLFQLSAQTCTILMDTVAHVLAREIREFAPSEPIAWTPVGRDCLFLLFAILPCHLSDKAAAIVASCFKSAKPDRVTATCRLLYSATWRQNRPALCLHIQSRLRPVYEYLDAYEAEVSMWQLMSQSCCTCTDRQSACNLCQLVLERHADTISPELKHSTCTLMTSFLLRQIQKDVPWGAWHRTIMLAMSDEWAVMAGRSCQWYPALSEVARLLMTRPQYAQHFHRHLYEAGAYVPNMVPLFHRVFQETREVETTLATLHQAFSDYVNEKLKMPALLDGNFYLVLLYFINTQNPLVEWLVKNFSNLTIGLYIPLWRNLWTTMHTALRTFDPAMRTLSHADWALSCLRSIDSLDELCDLTVEDHIRPQRDFKVWAERFNTRYSFFDDDIVEDLMRFLPPSSSTENSSWRVRRLIWMQRGSRLSDVSPTSSGSSADRLSSSGANGGIHLDSPIPAPPLLPGMPTVFAPAIRPPSAYAPPSPLLLSASARIMPTTVSSVNREER